MVFNIKLNAEKKYEFNASNNEIDKILNDMSSRGCLMILSKISNLFVTFCLLYL